MHLSPNGRLQHLVVAIVAIATLLAFVPPAGAATTGPTPMGGVKWTVPVIRLHDTTPAAYREGIDIAIRSWNARNVGIRFARTTNPRLAHVTIRTKLLPGEEQGNATLGYARASTVNLDTALVATAPQMQGNTILSLPEFGIPETIADVTAHELGHVLGLVHTGGCSLMGAHGNDGCRYAPPKGSWACRLQERRDVISAARRYGGRGVVQTAVYCPRSATPAGKVGAIAAAPDADRRATVLTWRETTNSYGFIVVRSAPDGACPTTPDDAGTTKLTADYGESVQSWFELGSAPATYCVSVWAQNGRGALTGPTSVSFTFTPPTDDGFDG